MQPHFHQRTRNEWVVYLTLAVVLVLEGSLLRWSPVDDAYISFRYAENWAAGKGLVFNESERVEGYTNFLWTFFLCVGAKLRFDLPFFSIILGTCFAIGTIIVTGRLASDVAREFGFHPAMSVVAATILTGYPGWPYWAFAGLEGPLLAFLLVTFVWVGCRSPMTTATTLLCGCLGVLAALTRWEAILAWPIVGITQLIIGEHQSRRNIPRILAFSMLLTIGFGTYYFARYLYYGEMFPNTYYAKIGGSLIDRLPRGLIYLGELGATWLLPITGVAWLLVGCRRWIIVITTLLVVFGCYVIWTGADFFPWLRFFLPMLPLCAILAAAFVERVVGHSVFQKHKMLMRLSLTALILITINAIAFMKDYSVARELVECTTNWAKIGKWARAHFPPETRLAVAPIGCIGYYSGLPIIDVLGLVDYEVAHFGEFDSTEAPGHQRGNVASVLRRTPEIVIGHGPLFEHRPTEAETISLTRRKTLLRLIASDDFKRLYTYRVARVDGKWLGFWEKR